MKLKERIENNIILIICGAISVGAGAGWTLCHNLYVSPRNEKIAWLEKQIEELKPELNNELQAYLKITFPKNNSIVKSLSDVRGNYKYINNFSQIYVFVYDVERAIYYPQKKNILVGKNKWEFKDIFIGSTVDFEKNFKIIITEVDPFGLKKLEQYFSALESAGITDLPTGIIWDKINVKRDK